MGTTQRPKCPIEDDCIGCGWFITSIKPCKLIHIDRYRNCAYCSKYYYSKKFNSLKKEEVVTN